MGIGNCNVDTNRPNMGYITHVCALLVFSLVLCVQPRVVLGGNNRGCFVPCGEFGSDDLECDGSKEFQKRLGLPTCSRRSKRSISEHKFKLNSTSKTIVTDCPIRGLVFEWVEFKRYILPWARQPEDPVAIMDLDRGINQRRYFTGKFRLQGKLVNITTAGLVRTDDGARWIIIPQIVEEAGCAMNYTNDFINSTGGSSGNNHRFYKMWLNTVGNKKYINYMKSYYHAGAHDLVGFKMFNIQPGFFRNILKSEGGPYTNLYKTIGDVIDVVGKKISKRRRSRRAAPTISDGSCAYFKGTKELPNYQYFTGAPTANQKKMYPICIDLINARKSCSAMKKAYPNWFNCDFSAINCGWSPGDSAATNSGSNEEIGELSLYQGKMNTEKERCLRLELEKARLEDFKTLNDVDADILRQLANATDSSIDINKRLMQLTKDHESDLVNVSQAIGNLESNILLNKARSDAILKTVHTLGDGLASLAEQQALLAKIIDDLDKNQLAYLISTTTQLVPWARQVGKIVHFELHLQHNSTPLYPTLDTIYKAAKRVENVTQASIASLGTTMQRQFKTVVLKLSDQSSAIEAGKRQSENLEKQQNRTHTLLLDNKKRADETNKQIKANANSSTKKIAKLERVGVIPKLQRVDSSLIGSPSASLDAAFGMNAAGSGLALIIAIIALILSCKSQK